MISIAAYSDTDETKRLTINQEQPVHGCVTAEAFGCERQEQVHAKPHTLEGESFDDNEVDGGIVTFLATLPPPVAHLCVYVGSQDGTRLSVSRSVKTRKASVRDVAAEIVACNPVAAADGLTVKWLMKDVEVDPEDASHALGMSWGNNGIAVLPESIGDLTVVGDLCLDGNKLVSLPESFGSLTVGGDLYLSRNKLESLLESFGSLTVGGGLYLGDNKLESLPESFGSLTVGGGLYLHFNQLQSLPESFGSLTVGGDLSLAGNKLVLLPESFGNLTVGGNLFLLDNKGAFHSPNGAIQSEPAS